MESKFDKLYKKLISEWRTYSDYDERERIQRDWDDELADAKAREQEDHYDDDDFDNNQNNQSNEESDEGLRKKRIARYEDIAKHYSTMSTKELEDYVYEDVDYYDPSWNYKAYMSDDSLGDKDIEVKKKAAWELVHRKDCNVQKMEDFFFNYSPREKEQKGLNYNSPNMRILKENFRNFVMKSENPVNDKITNGGYSPEKLIQALKNFHKWSTLFEPKKKHVSANKDIWLYRYEQKLLDKGIITQDVFTNTGTLNTVMLDKILDKSKN